MDFQLPFNSKIRVRLFHPVAAADSPCHRFVDILGISYDHDDFQTVDAVSAGYASQFHHPQHSCQKSVEDIRKDVDAALEKTPKQDAPASDTPTETKE